MENSAQKGVRVEKENDSPLAIVFDGGMIGKTLRNFLGRQGLVVVEESIGTTVEVEAAKYVFFFLTNNCLSYDWKKSLGKAVLSASRGQGKLIVVFDNVPKTVSEEAGKIVNEYGWPVINVEISGKLSPDSAEEVEAVGKLVRLAFSSKTNDSIVIVGKESPYQPTFQQEEIRKVDDQYFPTFSELPHVKSMHQHGLSESKSELRTLKVETKEKNARRGKFLKILCVAVLVSLPLVFFFAQIALGIWELKQVKQDLFSGHYFEAKIRAQKAKEKFSLAKEMVGGVAVVSSKLGMATQTEKIYELLATAETGSDVLYHASQIAPQIVLLPKAFLDQNEELDLAAVSRQIVVEGGAIERDLGFIEAEWNSGNIDYVVQFSSLLGISPEKVKAYFEQIGPVREMIQKSRAMASVLPDVAATSGRKTYLVVFQNSAELRPTGGFIGSYAVVHFDSGKLLDYKINDIYSADGQLRGRVPPPDEILHYLGQPNWFMRDANFAADFPLTAKRLEWFLEKETGQSVDGVVAVNLGAVQKMLKATGGVRIANEKDVVTADNFFQKAEYASEINFFPGSTQKRDFLGQVGEAILNQATGEGNKSNWLATGRGLSDSLNEKDILLYFNSTPVQEIMENNGWSGGIRSDNCELKKNICLMVVEANFGANKSNFYLKQSLEAESTINKDGKIAQRITLNMRNESPSDSWPGGTYKNYLRFLAPIGSKLTRIDQGDGRVATVSSVLTAQVLAKVTNGQFLVFQSLEPGSVNGVATVSAYASFGVLVEVPAHSNKVISINLDLPNQLDFKRNKVDFNLDFLKQPGNSIDLFNNVINYPSFLTPGTLAETVGMTTIASEQKLEYNTDLTVDRKFRVSFKR